MLSSIMLTHIRTVVTLKVFVLMILTLTICVPQSNSIPGLLKPPNSFTLTLHSASRAKNSHKCDKDKQQPPGEILRTPNGQERLPIPKPILSGSIEKLDHLNSNYSQSQYEKNIQLSKSSLAKDIRIPSHNSIITTSDKSSLLNDKKQLSNSEENQLMNASKCKIQRGYSWKLTRPSLRRKNSNTKHRSGSDSDAIIILNNGRDHSSKSTKKIIYSFTIIVAAVNPFV